MTHVNLRSELFAAHSPPRPDQDWNECHLLHDHLHDVAKLAHNFAAAFGAAEAAHYAGLWHDLGKFRPEFQRYIRGLRPREQAKTSHKWAGAVLAGRNKRQLGPWAPAVIFAIGCHHGGLRDLTDFKSDIKQFGIKELDEVSQAFSQNDLDWHLFQLQTPLPNTPSFKPTQAHIELMIRFMFSALIDADVLDTQRYWKPEYHHIRQTIQAKQATLEVLQTRFNAHMQQLTQTSNTTGKREGRVNRVRAQVLADCRAAATQTPGVFTLAVPTGGGKTLASMAFAIGHALQHQKRRIIVVLPFTSIIEQSAKVYREIFGAENVLEHHSAVNLEANELKQFIPKDQQDNRNFYHPAKLLSENWDAPIIVTTAVQFLESLHAHENSRCRKVHNIANSVVIMDEAQMLPQEFMDTTLQTLQTLSDHFAVSLVLCTATQPAVTDRISSQGKAQASLTETKPIIGDEAALFDDMERVRVHWPQDLTHYSTPEALVEQVQHSGDQVLLITHRRLDARELAERLGPACHHLSASMVPEHRSQVIAAIKDDLAHNRACRVVATQVVEAGVDIDFPVVFRAMAGMDSLAQAAGRCNRNNKLAAGDFYIFQAWTEPPSGVLQVGQSVTKAMLLKAQKEGRGLNLFDPAVYTEYFRELNGRLKNGTEKCMGFRQLEQYRQLSQEYRLISNQHTLPVIVPLATQFPATDKAIQRIKLGRAEANDFQSMQRATVNVPKPTVASWLNDGLLDVDQKAFMFFIKEDYVKQLYDERLGLDIKPLSSNMLGYWDF